MSGGYREGTADEAVAAPEGDLPLGVLPVSPSLLFEELGSAIRLLQKHQKRLGPLCDGQALSEDRLAPLVVEFVGELLFTAAKLESLARVVNGESSGG